ncbi:hypothetical protein H920_05362 [Fukomys damarensis]|uniref:Uncharacterized protein n=1 Tax=Fukomys damarensis TaxID=885580 RepID=A0A091DM31_FUKDA|nr:hypothetical protein H920_05362 [Fukomys damarensis]
MQRPKDSGKDLELTAVSPASPYQEADASAMESQRVYPMRLKDLCQQLKGLYWKPGDDVQGEGEDWSSSEEAQGELSLSFPSYAIR